MKANNAIKFTVVGDTRADKTQLIVSYITHAFPKNYIQLGSDQHFSTVVCDGIPVKIEIKDTSGQEHIPRLMDQPYRNRLRAQTYEGTDVFVMAFSIAASYSLDHVQTFLYPDIREHHPNAPVILVGTDSHLRKYPRVLAGNPNIVTAEQAEAVRKAIGAVRYAECSTGTEEGLKEAFEGTIRSLLPSYMRSSSYVSDVIRSSIPKIREILARKPQDNSPLTRLPAELRYAIAQEVVGIPLNSEQWKLLFDEFNVDGGGKGTFVDLVQGKKGRELKAQLSKEMPRKIQQIAEAKPEKSHSVKIQEANKRLEGCSIQSK